MPRSLTASEARLMRLDAQQLIAPAAGVIDAMRAVCAIQAQDMTAGALAIRARTRNCTDVSVRQAVEARQLVRLWLMRGTLHLVAAEDVRWLLALLGPTFAGINRRLRDLGWSEQALERGIGALRRALANGPQTRQAVAERLATDGLPHQGQATVHLLHLATARGLIVEASARTHVLLDDWLPPAKALPPEQALAQLARRYLDAAAPATLADFTWWSGLSAAEARAGWQAVKPREVIVDGVPMWIPRDRPAPAAPAPLKLLSWWDTYLLSYRDRGLVIEPDQLRQVNPGGGLVHPVVLVAGKAEGLWRAERTARSLTVQIDPLGPLNAAAVEAEARDIARFLRLPQASVEFVRPR